MLVRPLIRICVPRREHLVVVAGDLGHRNRRSPAHAPATLANLIWSFHLNTSLKSSGPSASANRTEIGSTQEGESKSKEYGQYGILGLLDSIPESVHDRLPAFPPERQFKIINLR
jgi:hypothetical protein